jgi:Rieske Fe-S protein
MTSQPKWREDFPINWEEDHTVTRREFTKFLALTSCGLFLGTGGIAVWEWAHRRQPTDTVAVPIAQIDEVPVGGVKVFRYPTANDPCILIRLAPAQLAAYSQTCTHLSCPVHYEAERRQIRCPCHEGYFAVEDGRVLAGPPRRPLPRIVLSVRGAEIWAVEVKQG